MKAELIKTNGTIINVSPKNDRDFKLNEMREIIECDYIQIVETNDKRLMIIDEMGKIHKKELNISATRKYKYGDNDIILGNALIISKDQIR